VHVRVCRDCGEEYRPEVSVCADCGGVLEDRYPGQEAAAAAKESDAPRTSQLPPPDYVSVTLVSNAAEIVPITDRLHEAGIPFYVSGDSQGFRLWAHKGDVERGRQVLGLIGDEPADDFNPETGYSRCPACGAAMGPSSPVCPDCGLDMSTDHTCSECGATIAHGVKACPGCGREAD
jgi:double zinc ribbon protein